MVKRIWKNIEIVKYLVCMRGTDRQEQRWRLMSRKRDQPEIIRNSYLPRIRLCTHRFWKISESFRIGQVQVFAVVVGHDPREDRVLHQVVVAPSGQRVEGHQVLKWVEKIDRFNKLSDFIILIKTLKLLNEDVTKIGRFTNVKLSFSY